MRRKTAKEMKLARAAQASKVAASVLPENGRYIHYAVSRNNAGSEFVVHRIGHPGEASYDDFDFTTFAKSAEVDTGYINLFRLYEDGRAFPAIEKKDDSFAVRWNNNTNEAKKLVAAQFDTEFPENGKRVRDFTEAAVKQLSEISAPKDNATPLTATDLEALGDFLLLTLSAQEKKFLTGEPTDSLIGWSMPGGYVVFLPLGFTSAKYRESRAVSEIAGRVNAQFIVSVHEAWMRDPKTHERNGKEGLTAMIVLPDGSLAVNGIGVYERQGTKTPRVIEPLMLRKLQSEAERQQFLFPSWSAVIPQQAVAA